MCFLLIWLFFLIYRCIIFVFFSFNHKWYMTEQIALVLLKSPFFSSLTVVTVATWPFVHVRHSFMACFWNLLVELQLLLVLFQWQPQLMFILASSCKCPASSEMGQGSTRWSLFVCSQMRAKCLTNLHLRS